MSYTLDELTRLLPSLYRLRDEAQGAKQARDFGAHSLRDSADFGPLRSLLSVLAREGQIVREDIEALYDDAFIDSCAPWAVPYIGDLVGASPLEDIGDSRSARQQVAETLSLRQRKGTLAALEHAVRLATGWPVMAVEYWDRLVLSESMRRVRSGPEARQPRPALAAPGGTVDLRNASELAMRGPLDRTPRRAEVGQIDTQSFGHHGRWNLPNIGLHIYRIPVFAHGTPHGDHLGERVLSVPRRPGHYRFCQTGADVALFTRPEVGGADMDRRASPYDMPTPLTREALCRQISRYTGHSAQPNRNAFLIHITKGSRAFYVPADDILVADLSARPGTGPTAERWNHARHSTRVLVDPELGRFVLPRSRKYARPTSVRVYWHRGQAHGIGGYERPQDALPDIEPALSVILPQTERWPCADLAALAGVNRVDVSDDQVDIILEPGVNALCAGAGAFPTIACDNKRVRILVPAAAEVATVLLSGLRFLGCRGLRVQLLDDAGDGPQEASALDPPRPFSVTVEDCTITARRGFRPDGSPIGKAHALRLLDRQSWTIRRSIIDEIRTASDTVLAIVDSVILSRALHHPAIAAWDSRATGDILSLLRTSVYGRVEAYEVGGGGQFDRGALAVDRSVSNDPRNTASAKAAGGALRGPDTGIENCLILAEPDGPRPAVAVTVLQSGCVRYSVIPEGARVPRRYACRPALTDDAQAVRPIVTTVRIQNPALMQLDFRTHPSIFSGAEDGQEMGVGNRLRTTARLANLTRAKDEFVRFGHAAGPIFET